MSGLTILAIDKVGCKLVWCAPDGSTQKTVSMPCSPHEIVLSSDREAGYVSIYGSGTYDSNPRPGSEIQAVHMGSRELNTPISTLPYTSPHGLAFDQDGFLWVTCDRHGVLVVISPERNGIVDVIETGSTGTHWVIASPDGSRLYTSNKQDHFLTVVNPRRRRVENRIFVPHGTEGICLSPDGRWLFAADHRRAMVLRIDTQFDEVVEEVALQGLSFDSLRTSHHMRVRVSADGKLLSVAAYHHDRLLLIDTATTRQVVVKTGAGPMAMAFNPQDQSLLYLSNHDEGSVSIVDVAAGRIVKTFPCGYGVESMEFVG